MKFQAQRIREIEPELVDLRLTRAGDERAGPIAQLWNAHVRICEWHRLSNLRASLH